MRSCARARWKGHHHFHPHLDRCSMCTPQVNESPVWSELAHAQLRTGEVAEAIASYLLAQDSTNYLQARAVAGGAARPPCALAATAVVHDRAAPGCATTQLLLFMTAIPLSLCKRRG